MRIIHTGQALVDYVLQIPALPERGGNVYAETDVRSPGGSVNILLAAVRNGAETVFCGSHGTGPNGDAVRRVLRDEGVTLTNEPIEGIDTGTSICLLEPDERTFVTTLGAERRITVESLATGRPRPGDIVCIDGYTVLRESTREPIVAWLRTLPAGTQVVVDPGAMFAEQPARIREAVLAATTVWTSNLTEAWDLLGTGATGGLADAADALTTILGDDVVIVVRDGAAGCAVRENGRTTLVPGFPQEPVDTNGAGDVHTGILVAAVAAGSTWTDAARRANAGAAIKVTRLGPGTAPTAAEIDAFLAGRQEVRSTAARA